MAAYNASIFLQLGFIMNKTMSVYFSGTGFSISDMHFLTSSFYARTEESESQIKMGFSGTGVDYGFSGTIFGTGLDRQCESVIERVLQEINSGHQITLNVYGHSRGGIAALFLAKQLGNINVEKLTINLALLDPVPGNYLTTSSTDPFKISLANKTMDLSDCKPLKNVLALYPHVPLPAIACHAPLLASYPQQAKVVEEVVNGCHAEAEQPHHHSSRLVILRVEEFLVQNGTQLLYVDRDYHDAEVMKGAYLECYQQELAHVDRNYSRQAHSAKGMVLTATPGAKYLNDCHKALAGDTSQAPVALGIQPERGPFSWFKRFLMKHPVLAQALKWTLIALSAASIMYVTGGLAAIPFLAPIVLKLGALSILAFSPVVGGALAAIWYGAVKPLISKFAAKFFYPHYAMRKLETTVEEISGSTRGLIDALYDENLSPTPSTAPYHGISPLHSATHDAHYSEEQGSDLTYSL